VTAGELQGCGLGVAQVASPLSAQELWGAGGAFPGFGSALWYLPRRGISVAVFGNDVLRLASPVADVLLRTVANYR
jgi:CubicO group peptidase (beta-lactamase class C family)